MNQWHDEYITIIDSRGEEQLVPVVKWPRNPDSWLVRRLAELRQEDDDAALSCSR